MQSFLILQQLGALLQWQMNFGRLIEFFYQLRSALFPERRALHLADMSEIMSDV